ncbi:hypothetical protein WDJ51_01865 [Rathayibacter sp. YIM 133350]|uniref:DUF222 domain-containing protein n=1 Tax=Rathayibacter sp. YIM 133350 TaxID=3131992 RepID=UPI00307ED40B
MAAILEDLKNFEDFEDFDDEDWSPTERGHLEDCLDQVRDAEVAAARASAGVYAMIATVLEAARRSPEIYVGSVQVSTRMFSELLERCVAKDLALRLSMAENTVRGMMCDAEMLTGSFPLIWAGFRSGVITQPAALALMAAARGLPEELCDAYDAALAEPAQRLTPGKLKTRARMVRERLEHTTRQERFDTAATYRRVDLEPGADGMAWLHIYDRAAVLVRAKARIDANAKRIADQADERRTLEQVRADVAGDLLTSLSSFLCKWVGGGFYRWGLMRSG